MLHIDSLNRVTLDLKIKGGILSSKKVDKTVHHDNGSCSLDLLTPLLHTRTWVTELYAICTLNAC